MKGKWLTGALVLAMAAVTLAGCGAKDETKEKVEQVTLNEVAHSIFYAPQYVAIEEGYFADEGIDLTLMTGFGADKVLTAMISGEADIGFMGALLRRRMPIGLRVARGNRRPGCELRAADAAGGKLCCGKRERQFVYLGKIEKQRGIRGKKRRYAGNGL